MHREWNDRIGKGKKKLPYTATVGHSDKTIELTCMIDALDCVRRSVQ